MSWTPPTVCQAPFTTPSNLWCWLEYLNAPSVDEDAVGLVESLPLGRTTTVEPSRISLPVPFVASVKSPLVSVVAIVLALMLILSTVAWPVTVSEPVILVFDDTVNAPDILVAADNTILPVPLGSNVNDPFESVVDIVLPSIVILSILIMNFITFLK